MRLPEHAARNPDACAEATDGVQIAAASCASLGEDVSEVLHYVPEHFKVIRHVQPKLSCTKCDSIVQAAAPSRLIEPRGAGKCYRAMRNQTGKNLFFADSLFGEWRPHRGSTWLI